MIRNICLFTARETIVILESSFRAYQGIVGPSSYTAPSKSMAHLFLVT